MNAKPYNAVEVTLISRTLRAFDASEAEMLCALDPTCAVDALGMFDDREARCDWDRAIFDAAYKLIETRTPMHAFLERFPAIVRDVQTGGGHTAWTLDIASGEQLLFTDGDGHEPHASTDGVLVQYYDAHGEWDEVDRSHFTWSELAAFVAGFLAGKVL